MVSKNNVDDRSDEDCPRRVRSSASRRKAVKSRAEETDTFTDGGKDQVNLVFAQKLNNNAAMCIEMGYYDRAIQSLQKALKYSQSRTDEGLSKLCTCKKCKADGCIDFSADFESNFTVDLDGGRRSRREYDDDEDASSCSSCSSDDEDNYVRKREFNDAYVASLTKSISQPKVQKVYRDAKAAPGRNASWNLSDDFCEDELNAPRDEIYKRPVRVTQEGHPMGATLFLVITFNLALTHHLEVLATYHTPSYDRKYAKKTLLFYELTSTYEKRVCADQKNPWDALTSIRFNTVLNSNLNELFYMLPEKCHPSAQRLLASSIDALDEQTEIFSGNRRQSSVDRELSSLPRKRSSTTFSISSRASSGASFGTMSNLTLTTKSPRVSSHAGVKNRLQLALGGMAPSPSSGKSKLHIALGDMAPASKASGGSLRRERRSSKSRGK
jgi:tetratricopeptide (TPR) repeat protein